VSASNSLVAATVGDNVGLEANQIAKRDHAQQQVGRLIMKRATALALMMGLSINSAEAASITEYPVVDSMGLTYNPSNITAGPDGNLWFTDTSGNYVGKITPAGIATAFAIPGPLTLGVFDQALAITTGPDGNVWFTTTSNAIGRATPAGDITLFQIGDDTGAGVVGIASGPDGNLWFMEGSANIGRITPAGVVTEFPIPPLGGDMVIQPGGVRVSPSGGITAGGDGNLWFAGANFQQCSVDFCTEITGVVGRITTSGSVTEFTLPMDTWVPTGITKGPDGNVWFTEVQVSKIAPYARSGGKIGRISPSGLIAEFSIPTANALPQGISGGPDGNLWFTETKANQIAKITPAGSVSELAIPTINSGTVGITSGPDGNIWFTETATSKVGKLTPSSGAVFVDGYMSGNWYDPEQSGQGFQIEMAAGNTMVAIWFTYAPDGGGQNWIYAQGDYDSTKNTVTLPAVLATGAMFPPNFHANDVTKKPWGTITFAFSDCNTGTVGWSSSLPGYGSGTLPISRLTRIKGTSCP
jgi:streptogramin lyase